MRILLTTHQLADFAGSEVYTFELARALKAHGHQVVVYSRYVDVLGVLFAQAGIEVVTDLALLAKRQFDVAHVHHHINALEVRLHFPHLPIFFLSHGAKTFLENPPGIDINITRFGAVSQRVKQSLRDKGTPAKRIALVNNIVDDVRFAPQQPLSAKPHTALIISNRMDAKTVKTIREACRLEHISLMAVGSSFRRVRNSDMPNIINQADVVFTIGRGVLETVMCGRIPFVLDFAGGDGLLTTKNFSLSAAYHFSGMYRHQKFSVAHIRAELRKYDPEQGEKLRALARRSYSPTACVRKLEKIYAATIAEYQDVPINQALLTYIVETVRVTRLHTFSRSEHQGLVGKLRSIKRDLHSFLVGFNSPKFL